MRPSPPHPPESADYSSKETRLSPTRPLIGLDAEGRLAQASYMMPMDDSTCEDSPGPDKVCTGLYTCVFVLIEVETQADSCETT